MLHRPGHSTTDTLLVDDRGRLAFVGDHLLARVSSNTEIYPAAEPTGTRPRARVDYLASLRRTARMPLERLLTGHGDPVLAHARLVRGRFAEHERRCARIAAALEPGPATAYEIAQRLWPSRTVREQPLLVVWEVLGHLDLLLDADAVREAVTDDVAHFELTRRPHTPAGRRRAPRTAPTNRKPMEVAAVHEPADTVAAPQGARDLFDLCGRVAVVTGGTRGLGLAMATAFAQAGAEVVVVSRKADACRDVAARLRDAGWRATGHCACHVGHWEELERPRRGPLPRLQPRRRARQQRRRLAPCTAG